MVRYFVRVRLKTGRWRGTPEQRQQDREQRRAKCSVGAGASAAVRRKRELAHELRDQVGELYGVRSRTARRWQRAAAWLVLAAYALVVLGVAALASSALARPSPTTTPSRQSAAVHRAWSCGR